MDLWTKKCKLKRVWTCDSMDSVDLRTCGPVDLWTCGLRGPVDSVDLWTLWTCGLCGPVDSVDSGPVDLWTLWTL